jgi:acetyl esterase/lipase
MKRIIALLLAGLGVAALVSRHRKLGNVAPELRTPPLYVPMSVTNQRSLAIGRKLMTVASPVRDGIDVRTHHVTAADGTPVRVLVYHRPERETPAGALLWIHGGGLVMGTPEVGNDVCSRIADELGIAVVSVDYRLAPEFPFPTGLEDCVTALGWLHDHADDLGIDPARVAVGGDSAGGGLAACVAQVALDRGGLPVCFQLLQYPMLDDRTPLFHDLDALLWTNASNRFAWTAYLGHAPDLVEDRPYASASRRDDLSGLPPAWIGIGEIDLFHREAVAYADRLRAAGVTCELDVVPGMYHAAERTAPKAESMQAFSTRMVTALGNALAPVPA